MKIKILICKKEIYINKKKEIQNLNFFNHCFKKYFK